MRTILVLLLVLAPAAFAQDLNAVIRDVETAYGRLNDLKAEFSQSSFNKSLGQTIEAEGIVYLKKGGKLLWEYTTPTAQEIVSDGKTLWVYTPTLNQVNVARARYYDYYKSGYYMAEYAGGAAHAEA